MIFWRKASSDILSCFLLAWMVSRVLSIQKFLSKGCKECKSNLSDPGRRHSITRLILLLRNRVLGDFSIEQVDGALRVLRKTVIMRDHADGRSVMMQFAQ